MGKQEKRGPGNPLRSAAAALKNAFLGKGGAPRAGWLLALGYAAYVAWAYGVSQGLTRAFSALFAAWGLTSANLQLAPAWARLVARGYGGAISIVSSAGILALVLLLWRLLKWERPRLRFRPAEFGAGAGAGLLAVLLSAGLFLLTDSMRLTHALAAARFSGELLLLLAVYFAAACAEEAFCRAFVLRAVRGGPDAGRTRTAIAGAASAAMLLLTTGSLSLGAVGAINMVLVGLLCAALHLRGAAWAAIGFRFGWSYVAVALVNFPGSSAASAPLLRLYHVSEAWLTGGGRGLICGLGMTLLLAAALASLLYARRGEWRKH